MLSGLTNLELLVVALDDSVSTGPLPFMPGLKQLILTDVNDKLVLNDQFLSENKSLERLIIIESKRIDFSVLALWTFLFGLLFGTIKHLSKSIIPSLIAGPQGHCYSPPILYKYFCVLSISEFLSIAGVAHIPESI